MMNTLRLITTALICITLAGCEGAFATSTHTPSITPFPFVTATSRPTATPTTTPTTTLAPTRTDAPFTLTPTASATATLIVPTRRGQRAPTPTPTEIGICIGPPLGVFNQVFIQDPGLPSAMGCTTAPPDSGEEPQIWVVEITYQSFERGFMIRTSNVGWYEAPVIYTLFDDATYARFDDLYDPTEPGTRFPTPVPPDGRTVPSGALYKVWNEVAGLREKLGFATADPIVERFGQMQMFEYGEMYFVQPFSEVYVFRRGSSINSWASYIVSP